ncbi:MAG: hypothetical protein M3439_06965 [Chloroflexota bacterium]|nr:hypothetical protein [Chloroflexota bacterium]
MSTTVNVQFTDEQMERLEREARRLGKSPSEVAVRWVDEALRQSKHPYIEFREAYLGRDAFLRGTRLKIWLLANHVRANDGNVARTAEQLEVPEAMVANAMKYAAEYATEIDAAIAENHAVADEMRTMMPNASAFQINASHS